MAKVFLGCLAAVLGLLIGSAVALDGRMGLEGVDLVLTLADGRALRREALIGLSLTLGSGAGEAAVRIDGFEEDRPPVGDPLPLYRMSVLDPTTHERRDLCEPDPDGRRVAFAFPTGAGGFSLTCTSGVEGKCVLFGYHPWEEGNGIPMRALHAACMAMFRADYGGDDHPSTRNGTKINFYDRFGIQKVDHAPGMAFEAAWGAEGALCVSHPRIADHVALDELAQRYPHLKGRLGPHVCYEEAMRADPRAILFNESTITWRTPQ
ncbi:ADYC domain-containing protein [Microvirga antarctica]|uniref:ADYC domain-containing protein n=1 Tax=Microvirga antarctica TaxID=2819233 RepID=UPI001B308E23|nr:ADYC domain-containing protein [Microvirga antarctica]